MTEYIGEYIDIDLLTPHPDNPRINNHAVEEVAGSIKRFGFASPIIARLEDRMILCGHTRFKAAQSIGLDKVPVRFMDLDPVDAKLLMLADNKIGERADWDEDALQELFEELQDEDLSGLGWDEDESFFNIEFPDVDGDEISDNTQFKESEIRYVIYVKDNHDNVFDVKTSLDEIINKYNLRTEID